MLILAGGAAMLCAASAAAAVAVAGRIGLSPGRRALLHWAPISLAVVTARALGRADVALGLIFGTSVAVMSSAVGSLCTVAPVGPAPARWKRLWPFAMAAVLIVFVSGFNGLLTWKHGLALGIEGLVILSLWRDPAYQHDWAGVVSSESPAVAAARLPESLAWGAAGASMALALTGAWMAVAGATDMGSLRLPPGALAASLLSLALASPLVQSGRQLALGGLSWIPMTSLIGVVLLNLCVLLPIIALTPYASALLQTLRHSQGWVIDWQSIAPQATIFPLAAWRIDTVVLIILAALQLPVAVGKWNLGREEGYLLIAGYCAYLLVVTTAGL
jgi:hypothetical protein